MKYILIKFRVEMHNSTDVGFLVIIWYFLDSALRSKVFNIFLKAIIYLIFIDDIFDWHWARTVNWLHLIAHSGLIDWFICWNGIESSVIFFLFWWGDPVLMLLSLIVSVNFCYRVYYQRRRGTYIFCDMLKNRDLEVPSPHARLRNWLRAKDLKLNLKLNVGW